MVSLRRVLRRLRRRELHPVVRAVRADALTYLDEDALQDLIEQVQRLERDSVPGALIEAGCALGGSAIAMAAVKSQARAFLVYDVFGMIPPPSERDGEDVKERYEQIRRGDAQGIEGEAYYGYVEGLKDKVEQAFRRHGVPVEQNNVSLIEGLFQDTLRIDGPVALAHIDGDWYESVRTCLARIEPHIASGGVLVIDDYDHWSGCRTAVDEYFANRKASYEFVRRTRLHIVRR
jgi:asparagine synthase (glutamine-hydrolysing)